MTKSKRLFGKPQFVVVIPAGGVVLHSFVCLVGGVSNFDVAHEEAAEGVVWHHEFHLDWSDCWVLVVQRPRQLALELECVLDAAASLAQMPVHRAQREVELAVTEVVDDLHIRRRGWQRYLEQQIVSADVLGELGTYGDVVIHQLLGGLGDYRRHFERQFPADVASIEHERRHSLLRHHRQLPRFHYPAYVDRFVYLEVEHVGRQLGPGWECEIGVVFVFHTLERVLRVCVREVGVQLDGNLRRPRHEAVHVHTVAFQVVHDSRLVLLEQARRHLLDSPGPEVVHVKVLRVAPVDCEVHKLLERCRIFDNRRLGNPCFQQRDDGVAYVDEALHDVRGVNVAVARRHQVQPIEPDPEIRSESELLNRLVRLQVPLNHVPGVHDGVLPAASAAEGSVEQQASMTVTDKDSRYHTSSVRIEVPPGTVRLQNGFTGARFPRRPVAL
ncbi:alcohol dehydrogenase, putative [Babesia ovata]|uniref:Alcohol dehydrogenase, putative n=1 Tax=Babesia ovata TaxID=189622 RepID=A0A2H6KBI4_9APIC|nr:alcohol dehydrogenase, putative [Babesia ovata]GBE60352.1 alcohol dehydrogenase, putative [Babesia ovata]